jgi:homeobox-leucine zipper protein
MQGSNGNQSNVIFLQESCTDACSALIVYAPVDFATLNTVLRGEEQATTSVGLPPPSGFVILPDGDLQSLNKDLGGSSSSAANGGCLLTTSIQIAMSHVSSSGKLSIESVNMIRNIIVDTMQNIRAALHRTNS